MEETLKVPFQEADYQRCQEIAEMLSQEPAGFGVPISDRRKWKEQKEKVNAQEYIESAEKYLDLPAVFVSDDNYLEVGKTGQRQSNDRLSGQQVKAIRCLCLAECLEGSGRYISKYEEAVEVACSQKSWTLSIHDNDFDTFYGRDMYIDLRAATFGWQLAQCDYLLGDKVSKRIRFLLRENLDRRILKPFEQILDGKKEPYSWMTAVSNWNVVCLSGCLGIALAVLPDRQERARFVHAFEKFTVNGLGCYREDGYCIEEIGYWGYGFSHYLTGAEIIRRSTQGRLDLFQKEGIRLSCLFGLRTEITDQVYASVGDTRYGTKAHPINVLYTCNRLGIENQSGLKNTDVSSKQTEYIYQLLMFWFWQEEYGEKVQNNVDTKLKLRDYFDSMQVLISRPGKNADVRMGAFIKGGDNQQPHNHLDVGNFIIEVNGETLIADCGHPPYNASTFTPARYQVRMLNSYGHNVPYIGGCGQKGEVNDGRDGRKQNLYGAKVLDCTFTEEKDEIAYDLKGAYDVPFLKELTRRFTYERNGDGKITIHDHFTFTKPETFEIALMTYADVIYDKDLFFLGDDWGIKVELSGQDCRIKFETLEACMAADTDQMLTPKRVGIQLKQNCQEGEFTITVTPFAGKKEILSIQSGKKERMNE